MFALLRIAKNSSIFSSGKRLASSAWPLSKSNSTNTPLENGRTKENMHYTFGSKPDCKKWKMSSYKIWRSGMKEQRGLIQLHARYTTCSKVSKKEEAMILDSKPLVNKKLKNKRCVSGKWSRPPIGWFKLNIDGSVLPKKRSAAAGGLIRDENGKFIRGFSKKLDYVTSTDAELMALHEGLTFAWKRQFSKLVIESDSESSLHLIQKKKTINHPLKCIIEECRELLQKSWKIKLQHTKRCGNVCADKLAKLGHNLPGTNKVWKKVPGELAHLLSQDLR